MYELLHEFVAPHSRCASKYKNQIERYKCAGDNERSVRMLHEFVAPTTGVPLYLILLVSVGIFALYQILTHHVMLYLLRTGSGQIFGRHGEMRHPFI